MKKFKKMMVLVIAMVMTLALSVTAFASGEGVTPEGGSDETTPTTYAITIDTSKDKVTHTYKVYQIFTGKPDDGKLTDVQYGSSYPGGVTGAVPKSVLDTITDARAWATENKDNLGDAVATLDATTPKYDAVPGWYLVLDTNYATTAADAYSAFMVKVVDKDTVFEPKKEVPSVDKQVKDETDDAEEDAEDGWGETADHEIGETFQFKLIATIPADANLAAYDTYMVQFNDTMSNGVTFEKINSVKVNETPISKGSGDGDYTTTAVAGTAGGSWTLKIADIKKVSGINLGTDLITIEVIYDAHLNDDAMVNTASGSTDNENKVTLTYSNNPDATGTGDTDTTPEDKVFVFTYGNTGTKVDANNEPVAGAGFVLYKIDAKDADTIADSTDAPSGTAVPLYKNNDGYFVYNSANETAYKDGAVVANNEIITTSAGGNVFAIKGLDVGTYALYEKTVPTGYTQAKNTVFTITATHSESGKDVPYVDLGTSQTSETITNRTGSTLPETGGMGTTLFYIVGAILVIGAGVLLVTRRRMSAQ